MVAVELSRGMLDIAITGEDCIQEELGGGGPNGIFKIGDLGYGQTRLVIAVSDTVPYTSLSGVLESLRSRRDPLTDREIPILCFTEYVNLTRQKIMQDPTYQETWGNSTPFIQIRGLVQGENRDVQVLFSDGVTEGFIEKGADVIADSTQSGATLGEYRLREIGQIMESSAGLYAGPSCTGWKQRKAQEIFEQLQGAVVGTRFFDVKFNVPMSRVTVLREYLIAAGLCADEPTITRGEQYGQANILIPRETFPSIIQELKDHFGVSAIVRNDVMQYIP